ncbi:DUF975 family protein [Pseudobutyrivibrio xylanivorans]|uniref:DUF975 family protein n=1 Tax=Pseudobutyrivibrio xylanivorans TaxID=185007 RepID=A0A5P6VV15_PSEXY|nr:DUF975 family protein [Pseudobutyrivibrio xylanivorans]QFJ55134.1 DUF975 family protein [Pseudobutyrivibrio xylanivorans]
MWTIGEIKNQGKVAFRANYWRCVLVAFILSILTAGSASSSANNNSGDTSSVTNAFEALTAPEQLALGGLFLGVFSVAFIIGILIHIFLRNPLQVGCYRFFKANVQQPGAELGILKEGFSDFGHIFVTLLLRDIFLFLWFCLFLIPGIIKCYSYRMVPYIIKDNPELSATEVITKSREMMNGNKWRAFLLDLSFIGWIILGVITVGLVYVLWTAPYMSSTDAALYLELSKEQ